MTKPGVTSLMYAGFGYRTMRVDIFVEGTPYPWHKARGDVEAPERWSAAIRKQTEKLPAVSGPCRLEVDFVLPGDRFPGDHPFGTDLDNLLKRLLDALNGTVLANAPGKDGAIVELRACKVPAGSDGVAGARIVITDEPWRWAVGKKPG